MNEMKLIYVSLSYVLLHFMWSPKLSCYTYKF